MELWDIYDENKERTGATMKHNDWNMKPGEFHLTVLGVLMRPDGKYLITRRRMDKEWAARVGSSVPKRKKTMPLSMKVMVPQIV